ncbi:alpha/beta hydrolase [Clostridium estertheticum]|uniref:alpha/beta fold hydrolase n=1 Tax=Clostridium estertheticum TaxID=238834 RepID=UPI001C0BF16A|nr:alpha/beta fold hydrolase [Clostridium estertheticum]MBU3202110.1 alpha/beta hydrolase [Clostridium estertheticum]WAG64783.1 alpha/beta hydrolase [Clostridium estertheticum]
MKFEAIGNPNGPKVLFIHAMFMTSKSFLNLVEYLKEDYFIIMPTLDGHDVEESSTFLSIDDEVEKILTYLKGNNIDELDFILGTSLGAIIAFAVYHRNIVHINKVFLDGGPFLKFGSLFQRIAMKKIWRICYLMRLSPQNGTKRLDKLFPGLGKLMSNVCCYISKESVENLSRACYSFPLPKLDETAQKSVTFIYGTKEPARICIFRLKKYKYSNILKKISYSHCEYLLNHPKEYAEMLKK